MGMYTLNVQLYSAVFSAGIGRVDMIMLGKRPLNPADPSSGYPRLTTEQSFKLATPFSNGRADGAPGGGGGQRGGGWGPPRHAIFPSQPCNPLCYVPEMIPAWEQLR